MTNTISRILLSLTYALNPSVLCQQTRQTTMRGDLSLNLCERQVFGGVFQDVTVHYYWWRALVSNPVHIVSIIYGLCTLASELPPCQSVIYHSLLEVLSHIHNFILSTPVKLLTKVLYFYRLSRNVFLVLYRPLVKGSLPESMVPSSKHYCNAIL